MAAPRFDALTRLLGASPSRRALLPALGGLLASATGDISPASAKKKRKMKKKATLCLDGQTIQASKKKKKTFIKRGATPGACPPGCTPNCAGTVCGGDDGCGGTCGCATGSLCHSGVCHPCDITCGSGGAACDDDLKTALTGGGTVYVCPGRYVGNFTLSTNVALIGAGSGEDPAANTILDANGNGRVVEVPAGISAALQGLRITGGGNLEGDGGGILNYGTLTMTACTVDRNVAKHGGGIIVAGNAAAILNGSTLTGNEAQFGGGLFSVGTVTFDGASSVTGNTAAAINGGGGIYKQGTGTVTLNGANVSGNSPNNCAFVPTCIG